MPADRLQARVLRVGARTARDRAVELRARAAGLPAPLRGTMRELELLAEADAAAARAAELEADADALVARADVMERTDVITSG